MNSLVTMLCLFDQDFLKYYTKAGMDTDELEVGVLMQDKRINCCFVLFVKPLFLFYSCFKQRAVEVMCFVPKRCNDMMNVGRLQGFEVCLWNLGHP